MVLLISRKLSDEDDESNSMDSDPLPGFENLNVDDKNANCEGGAVGRLINSPSATAEIDLNCMYFNYISYSLSFSLHIFGVCPILFQVKTLKL